MLPPLGYLIFSLMFSGEVESFYFYLKFWVLKKREFSMSALAKTFDRGEVNQDNTRVNLSGCQFKRIVQVWALVVV